MYSLICDGTVIGKTAAGDLAFESGSFLDRVSAAGVLSATMLPENPYLGYIALRSSVLTLENNGKEIFRGQAVDIIRNDSGFYELSCLGDMSYLKDVQIAPFTANATPSNLLNTILTAYNGKASSWKKIYKGTCNISGTIAYELTSYRTAWDVISGLVSEYGGALEMRWLADGTRGLDWVVDSGRYNKQAALWGDNLLSLEIETDASAVVNKLICEGDNGLTVTASHTASANKYGMIYGYQKFPGITDAMALAQAGANYLGKVYKENRSVSGRAIDKTGTFRVGDFIRTLSQTHNLDEWLVCSELRHDLTMAKPIQVTLGRIGESLTDSTRTGLINVWIGTTQGTQPPRIMAKDANAVYAKSGGDYAVSLELE